MKLIKYYIYRLLWHIAPLLPNGKFIHLDIEINNSCNQRCIFCWHYEKDLPFNIETMSYDSVCKYIREGFEAGAKSIKFNLRGEPLLNHDLEKYIKLAKQLGYIDIMINTNGILLSPIQLLALDSAGLTSCIISVDSLHLLTYMKLHNCSSVQFERLMKHLLQIKHLVVHGKIKTKIKLNFHINEINKFEKFLEYKKLWKPFQVVIRDSQNRLGQHLAQPKKGLRKKHCPHMKRRLTITANEKVFPCCVCYMEPEDIELKGETLKEIWYSTKRKEMLKDYKNRFFYKTCSFCTSGDIFK